MLTREQSILAEQVKSLLDIIPVIGTLEKQINEHPTNLEFLGNSVFVCRKTKEILDSVKKKLNELESKCSYQACLVFGKIEEPNYKSEYCTISPNPEFYVKYPSSPNEEGYEEFVKQLPINAVRPHYPTVMELIMTELEKGGQVPFNLGSKSDIKGVEFKLRVTTKKEL